MKVPRAMRRIAHISQIVHTQLAAKLAWKWFLTPYPFKMPRREQYIVDRFDHPLLFDHSSGHQFPVYRYGQGEKHLVFVHGWSGRFSQFVTLFKFLEDNDILKEYQITAFNAVAHQGATGKQSAMPYFAESIDLIANKFGPIDLAIAHSLGCNALMYAQQKLDTPIKKQVLIAPPGAISEMVFLFCRAFGFNGKVQDRVIAHLVEEFGEDFDSNSCPTLAETNEIPTLVFHDKDDRDTPIELGRQVGLNMKNGTYVETKGLGHRKILHHKSIHEKILQFIQN